MSAQSTLEDVGRPQAQRELSKHLILNRDGHLECLECNSQITIDPNTGVEYGHRKNDFDGEWSKSCPKRPAQLDGGRS